MKNTTEQFRHPGNFAIHSTTLRKTRRHEGKRNRSVIIIFLLFFISHLAAQEIPNGIYLLSTAESRSFYPAKDSVVVTDAHDHKITLLVMPGPFFGEKDIYYSDYTLAFNEHNKNDYWCFEFSLVERGNVKRNELIERGAVLPFVFVFNEKAIAFRNATRRFFISAQCAIMGRLKFLFRYGAKIFMPISTSNGTRSPAIRFIITRMENRRKTIFSGMEIVRKIVNGITMEK
jgi:hypothetical protein